LIFLFTIGGRTGNLLFQAAYALSKRRKGEWLVSVGFREIRLLLEGPSTERWLNIETPCLRGFLERYCQPIAYRMLVQTGAVASDYENNDFWEIRPGRIRLLRIMKGYFQSSERHAPDLHSRMRLCRRLRDQARRHLEAVPVGKVPVFVHLRRSDKVGETIEGLQMHIPDHYYVSALAKLQEGRADLFYFILGDDPDHAEILFRDVSPKYVSRLSVEEDLALMSLCQGGVLSNSTLSWWGAFFSDSRIGYVAPKYWAGWNVKRWLPPELHGDFVSEYLDIS
jgi:hypothetical protein